MLCQPASSDSFFQIATSILFNRCKKIGLLAICFSSIQGVVFFIHHGGAADGKHNTLKEESEPRAADGSEESAADATSDRQRSGWHAVARSDQRATGGERENGKLTTSTRNRIGGRNPGTSPTPSGFTFRDPSMIASCVTPSQWLLPESIAVKPTLHQ